VTELEKKIGYSFRDPEKLKLALSHSSYANEHSCRSNERIEFLGDAVLELASSEFLYETFPDVPEGKLTKLRASFVCERALNDIAVRVGLPEYILLGKGEEATGGRNRPSVVSDAFESVIGAVYLDGGFSAAKDFVIRLIFADLDRQFFFDSKTALQELVQARGESDPVYRVVYEEGPDHDKRYTVEVTVNGVVVGTGTDTSKKHAAQAAALEAYNRLQ